MSRIAVLAKVAGALVLLCSLALPWSSCSVAGGPQHQAGFGDGSVAGLPMVVLFLWPIAMVAAQLVRPAKLLPLLAEILLCLATGLVIYMQLAALSFVSLGASIRPDVGPAVALAGLVTYFVTVLVQIVVGNRFGDRGSRGCPPAKNSFPNRSRAGRHPR